MCRADVACSVGAAGIDLLTCRAYPVAAALCSLLHTPHVPPSFPQCRQYRQFLHARQSSAPVHVAACSALPVTSSAIGTARHSQGALKRFLIRDLLMAKVVSRLACFR